MKTATEMFMGLFVYNGKDPMNSSWSITSQGVIPLCAPPLTIQIAYKFVTVLLVSKDTQANILSWGVNAIFKCTGKTHLSPGKGLRAVAPF
jgi:hypothetical protein